MDRESLGCVASALEVELGARLQAAWIMLLIQQLLLATVTAPKLQQHLLLHHARERIGLRGNEPAFDHERSVINCTI